jgi:hypothetical protein
VISVSSNNFLGLQHNRTYFQNAPCYVQIQAKYLFLVRWYICILVNGVNTAKQSARKIGITNWSLYCKEIVSFLVKIKVQKLKFVKIANLKLRVL